MIIRQSIGEVLNLPNSVVKEINEKIELTFFNIAKVGKEFIKRAIQD